MPGGPVVRPLQESAVPKSNVRKKKVYTPPAELRPQSTAAARKPSPIWVPVVAVALIVLGIGWLVVFYLTGTNYPIGSWRYWNLAIGFGAMVSALVVLSRWR
jgi:hypothetical protein